MFGQPPKNTCRMFLERGSIAVQTPYLAPLVSAIKTLPHTERKYDPARKVWLVDPKHGDMVANWIELYAGEKVSPPQIASIQSQKTTEVIHLRYVGSCKERDDGTISAFGLVGNDWQVIFPERVLRMWFEGIDIEETGTTPKKPKDSTLYGVLGIKKSANDEELQKAFRRMAMQWHPDHCKEPNAAEMFMQVKAAYDVLKEPNKRKRYDAGLLLEAKHSQLLKDQEEAIKQIVDAYGYRSPLRCGIVMVEGTVKLGRIVVEKIHAWEDWMENGKTLVSSWSTENNELVEEWV